ncbi:MAG: MaoC family dehydratase N-terminal domain-containing protein [Candidatus Rokubacteria bacterium]|nr:MaoC family dehydratase N-terminal domain-containing protein [Candidatus Rokubacteria bacterium]
MHAPDLDTSLLGRWTDEHVLVVDAARARAYAAATNDADPRYEAGTLAPPLFACVPAVGLIAPAVAGLITDEERRMGLHVAHDLHLHRVLVPGMTLRVRAASIGVQPRRLGAELVIKVETRSDGAVVNEQYVTLFSRRRLREAVGTPAPDHRLPAEAREAARAAGRMVHVEQTLDPDQTIRYAEASGDHNPIHLDPAVARALGLPGIIVHGMCTMAFAGRAVVEAACEGDPRRLARLAVRFARPVFPGQTITTHIWPAGQHDTRATWGFETLNPEGKAVLADGLGEVVGAREVT